MWKWQTINHNLPPFDLSAKWVLLAFKKKKLSQPIHLHMKSTLLEPLLSSEKGFRKGYCNKLVNLHNYTPTNVGHF